MRERGRNRLALVLAVLLAAAGFWCWLRAMARAEATDGWAGYRFAFAVPQSLDNNAWAALEAASHPFALAREDPARAEAPALARQRPVTRVEAWGDLALLYPALRFAHGAYPPAGERGCVIDQDTARALWGDDNAVGAELVLDGAVYTVAGVLAGAKSMVLVHTRQYAGFAPAFGHLLPGETAYARQAALDFLTALGQPEPTLLLDLGWAASFLRAVALLPPLLLCAGIAFACLELLPGFGHLRWVLLLPVVALCGRLLGAPLPFTPAMLPTRWSEFSFWSERWSAMEAAAYAAWRLPGTVGGYALATGTALPVIGYAAAATICLAVGTARLLRSWTR